MVRALVILVGADINGVAFIPIAAETFFASAVVGLSDFV
jgi:hypothetical protein